MKRYALGLLLAASCQSTGETDPAITAALTVLRTVGDVVLQVDGYEALVKYAEKAHMPELVNMVDADQNKILTLPEVEAFLTAATSSPEQLAAVLATLYLLHRTR